MALRFRGLITCSIVLGLTLAACGKSPTGPSSVETGDGSGPAVAPAPAPSPAGSATVSGVVVAPGSALSARVRAGAALPGVTITVVGTSVGAVADGNGRFRLENVPSGNQQLEFTGGGASGARLRLRIEEHEQVQVTVAVAGTSAQLLSEAHVTGPQAQLEGRITSVNAGARTFEVGTTTVQVPAGVPIRHGGKGLEFSNLHVNDRVHVKGAMTGDVLTATEVNVQQGEDTPGGGEDGDDEGEPSETSVSGSVGSLSGQCPALTFRIKGTTVKTTDDTEFLKGSCSDVRNGRKVEAEGLLTGLTLAAAKVSIDKN